MKVGIIILDSISRPSFMCLVLCDVFQIQGVYSCITFISIHFLFQVAIDRWTVVIQTHLRQEPENVPRLRTRRTHQLIFNCLAKVQGCDPGFQNGQLLVQFSSYESCCWKEQSLIRLDQRYLVFWQWLSMGYAPSICLILSLYSCILYPHLQKNKPYIYICRINIILEGSVGTNA